jgi:hypothetical protein
MSENGKGKGVKDTLSDIEIKEARKKIVPSALGVKDAHNLVVQDPTPIKDMSQEMAYVAIGEMRKYTKSIADVLNSELPALKKTAQAAADNAEDAAKETQILGVQMEGMDRRVCKLEEDLPAIQRDLGTHVYEGGKTRATVSALQGSIGDVKDAAKEARVSKRGRWTQLIATIVTLAVAAVGGVYVIGQMSQRVEDLSEEQDEDVDRIEDSIKTVKQDVKNLSEDINELTKTVLDRPDGETAYCNGLSDATVRRMKRTIPRDEWPRCDRFRGP